MEDLLCIPNNILIPEIVSQLEEGNTVTLQLSGNSMRPFLKNGRDKALLTRATGHYSIGEPILAEIAPGCYALHRIINIDGENITMLGDGNLTPEHCKKSDVRASVIGFYRKGRNTLDHVDGCKWRTYSYVWMALRPIRRYLLGIHRRLFGL